MRSTAKVREPRAPARPEGAKDRKFVTALARGLNVLRGFRPGDVSLGNLELAERTGLPKPTISRLTYTLTQLGYLTHSEKHGTYQLGPAVLSLGYAMLTNLDIRERVRPMLQELSNQVDATVALGARDGLEAVYLEVCRGPAPVTLHVDVGRRVPLAPTAMGRALLTALGPEERAALMRRIEQVSDDAATYANVARDVARAVDEVARQGFCFSIGAWRAEVNAIGVPLVTHDQKVYGLICGGPAFRISREKLATECGPRLVELAKRISASA